MGYNTGSLDGPKFYVVVKKRHNNLYYRRPIIDKYIGFGIDSKKTIACVVQRGKKDRFTTLKTDINRMKDFLNGQRRRFWPILMI
jgi:hypothetical protein